jgi:small subunit ribosomal protein S6
LRKKAWKKPRKPKPNRKRLDKNQEEKKNKQQIKGLFAFSINHLIRRGLIKPEGGMMKRKYEIGFVINPEASEEEVKKVIDSIVEIIKNAGGNIENVDEWGRRKLAYPVQKHNEGIYVFINANMVGSTFVTIERRLKLTEKVMRFIVLRMDDKMKKANRLTRKWKRGERLSKRSVEEEGTVMIDEIQDQKEAGK